MKLWGLQHYGLLSDGSSCLSAHPVSSHQPVLYPFAIMRDGLLLFSELTWKSFCSVWISLTQILCWISSIPLELKPFFTFSVRSERTKVPFCGTRLLGKAEILIFNVLASRKPLKLILFTDSASFLLFSHWFPSLTQLFFRLHQRERCSASVLTRSLKIYALRNGGVRCLMIYSVDFISQIVWKFEEINCVVGIQGLFEHDILEFPIFNAFSKVMETIIRLTSWRTIPYLWGKHFAVIECIALVPPSEQKM